MVEYRKARQEEAADILDFINYVFSQAHRPHDFRKFNPPMYGSGYPFWKEHYVAVEDGRIRATLSVTKKEIECGGVHMTYGHIGQVSVHPYARGEGHMKRLMHLADDDMRISGFDYAELGGQRQRYNYFGFTQGACHYEARVTSTNTRHVLNGRECAFIAKKRPHEGGWIDVFDLLDEEGDVAGRVSARMAVVDDLSLLPDACEAFFRASGEKEMNLTAALHETDRIRALQGLCEQMSLTTGMLYKVFNYKKYIRAALTKKAEHARLEEGEMKLEIDGEPIRISVCDGNIEVSDGVRGEGRWMSRLEAQEMLFSPASPALYPFAPLGWFPVSV